MKTRNIELEVDYIGGEGSLTESEEKALSEFFKMGKSLHPQKKVTTTLTKNKKRNS